MIAILYQCREILLVHEIKMLRTTHWDKVLDVAESKVFVSLRSVFHKDRVWVGQQRLALKTHQ